MKTFEQWVFNNLLNEYAGTTRYSVEVNYRTNTEEALEAFAKIALGYVSATVKGDSYNYHVKHVFNEKPVRIIIASRNWEDGEWVGIVSFSPQNRCFMLSKGFYNKDRRTVSIQNTKQCAGTSAAEVAREAINFMHELKGQKDRTHDKLKPVPLKRGPKS